MRLSKNFTLEEFTASDTAKFHSIDNTPTSKEIENMRHLCQTVLQPLRDYLGEPIRVTSGFRCPELNERVGGSKTSHHQCEKLFAAADIVVNGVEVEKVIKTLQTLDLPVEQVINEYGKWTHVSARRPKKHYMSM